MLENIPDIQATLKGALESEVFLGFLAFSVIGGLFYTLKSIPAKLIKAFTRLYTVELVFRNSDEIYSILLIWMYKKGLYEKSRRLRAGSSYILEDLEEDNTRGVMIYPGDGYHLFWHKGRPILCYKQTEESKMSQKPETITLRTLGRSQKVLFDVLKEAKRINEESDKITIHDWTSNHWAQCAKKNPRPESSLIMDENKKQNLITDIAWFKENQKWYEERGIPYHRGYMLYGPPGTGKTSIVFMIASVFEMGISTINLNSIRSDGELQTAFREHKKNTILLLEDVDTNKILSSRTESLRNDISGDQNDTLESPNSESGDGFSVLTLSGILNVMDGIATSEGRILFMTTNDPSNLDAAFVRPGRVDMKVEIGYPSFSERKQMFLKFFPDRLHLAEKVAKSTENITPAEMQELFMRNLENPEKITDLGTFV